MSTGNFAGSEYFKLTPVTDGVYAGISIPGRGSLGNAAIVDLGDVTLVVDTMAHLKAAQDLRNAAEQLTGRPAAYVFNTHWHADHTYGNQLFAPEAKFISTGKTREILAGLLTERTAQHLANRDQMIAQIDQFEKEIEQEKDTKLHQELRWEVVNDREYISMLPDVRLTVPSITFDQELKLHGSKRSVRLITYGGGHSQSDAFLYLPEEKLIVIGDLVLSGYHLVMNHGNPWEWLRILDLIEALGVETIVPGHGDVCTIDALHQARAYIQSLISRAVEMDPLDEELEGVTVPEEYDDWLFRFDYKNNLKKIRELSRDRAAEA